MSVVSSVSCYCGTGCGVLIEADAGKIAGVTVQKLFIREGREETRSGLVWLHAAACSIGAVTHRWNHE